MSTIWGSDHIKSRHIVYCGIDCMKKFCASLRERAKNIIDLEKKKNVTVNKRRIEILKIKLTGKSEIIVIIQVNIEVQHIVVVI